MKNKQLYRLVNVVDKEGNTKEEFIEELRKTHPKLLGKITNKGLLTGNLFMTCLHFEWADDSNKMLKTSMVIDYVEDNDKIIVTTMNSVYTFEKENN